MSPTPSAATLQRLGLLLNILHDLADTGRDRVTSQDLSRWLGTTPATVRKDLSWCRGGTAGAAYVTSELRDRVRQFLDPEPRPLRTAVAGLGEWGLALADDLLKRPRGRCELLAGFDSRANRLEQLELSFPLFPTTEITPVSLRLRLDLAILALPSGDAQKVAERFVQGGVRRIINYTSSVLRLNRRQIQVSECGLDSLEPF